MLQHRCVAFGDDGLHRRGHLVDPRAQRELLNARKSFAVMLISSTGCPNRMLSKVIAVLSYTDQSARS